MAEDEVELDLLMIRFLRAVSFQPGEQSAYGDLHGLFVEAGKLINTSSAAPEISTVEEFVRPRQETVDSGALQWFQEAEVAAITEIFGNVAQRFSTYEKRGLRDDAAIDARGVISTQFIRTEDGWRMSSMAWSRTARRDSARSRARHARRWAPLPPRRLSSSELALSDVERDAHFVYLTYKVERTRLGFRPVVEVRWPG
jgi:hypothetical protein